MRIFVEPDFRSLIKHGEELCGDRVSVIRSQECCTVVMADGLGSGVKANILATLTTGIAATMLSKGAPLDEVVETMVATLPTCQVRKLAYSTFTILQIYSDGTAHLVEFDNPLAFILRDGHLLDIPRQERQVGPRMLSESTFQTHIGDMICIVSDGVVHAGIGGILNLGWTWEAVGAYLEKVSSETSAARVVALLSSVVDNLYLGQPGDDATVMGIRICEPVDVTLFAGPPESPDMDDDVVKRFMSTPGRKVVCGGTAAGIVSRILGREIVTSLELVDPEVPPIAYIEGVDLVTEGVLTLAKTIQLIKRCSAESGDKLTGIRGRDGASRLARLLMEECTNLSLMVGRGINPAHQNPNLPHNLSLKVKVVEELKDLLISHGKEVSIEYF